MGQERKNRMIRHIRTVELEDWLLGLGSERFVRLYYQEPISRGLALHTRLECVEYRRFFFPWCTAMVIPSEHTDGQGTN